MNKPRFIASLLLLFAAVNFTWRQLDLGTGAEEAAGRPEPHSTSSRPESWQGGGLVAAFVGDPNALSDEEYRQAALAYEAQKKSERAAAERPAGASDPSAPYRGWRRRVERVRAMVDASEEFPEGSVQWHLREELKQLLQEEPRPFRQRTNTKTAHATPPPLVSAASSH